MAKDTKTFEIDWNSDLFRKKAFAEATELAKGEPVEIELSGKGPLFWVHTSELGMYRIWDGYSNGGKNDCASKGYSSNLKTHYVRVEATWSRSR